MMALSHHSQKIDACYFLAIIILHFLFFLVHGCLLRLDLIDAWVIHICLD